MTDTTSAQHQHTQTYCLTEKHNGKRDAVSPVLSHFLTNGCSLISPTPFSENGKNKGKTRSLSGERREKERNRMEIVEQRLDNWIPHEYKTKGANEKTRTSYKSPWLKPAQKSDSEPPLPPPSSFLFEQPVFVRVRVY